MLTIHLWHACIPSYLLLYQVCSAVITSTLTDSMHDNWPIPIVSPPDPKNIINSISYFTMQRVQNKLFISEIQSYKLNNANTNIFESQGASIKYINTDNYNFNNNNPNQQLEADIKVQPGEDLPTAGDIFYQPNISYYPVEEVLSTQELKSQIQKKIQFLIKNSTINKQLQQKPSNLSNSSAQVFNSGQLPQSSNQTANQSQNKSEVILYNGYGFSMNFFRIPFIIQSFRSTYTAKRVIDTQFQNIGFYHIVPTQYVEGEVFRFSGTITNDVVFQKRKSSKVTIIFIERITSYQIVCVSQNNVDIDNQQFNISCRTDKPGSYYMYAFVVGTERKFSVRPRTVKSSQNLIKQYFLQATQPEPTGLRLQVTNNSLYVVWDSRAALTNLTIYQIKDKDNLRKIQYLLSNNHERFRVPFADFTQFLPVTTYVQISHAMSINGSLSIIYTKFTNKKDKISFKAIDHAFDKTSPTIIFTPDLPWKVETGQSIIMNITLREQIQNTLYIIEPDLLLNKKLFLRFENETNLTRNTLKAGQRLQYEIILSKEGTHIIQINNIHGLAVANRPIYVGEAYPLIPDYKDLQPPSFIETSISKIQIFEKYYQRTTQKLNIKQPSKKSALQQKREYLLTLINGLRRKYKVPELQLDQSLSQIAQNHSDDMVLKNYVSHTNLAGQKSIDRARKFNFSGLISQNIALTDYLIDNHLGLQRSAIHLQNTINRFWRRVGIGINITRGGQYVATYEYSPRDLKKSPLTPEEQQKFKQKIIKAVRSRNPNVVKEDKKLSQDIKDWMESDRQTGIFQFIVKKRGFRYMDGFGLNIAYVDDWVERLQSMNSFDGRSRFRQVGAGIGVKKSQNGTIEAYIVFA